MSKILIHAKLATAAIVAGIVSLLGGWDMLLRALMTLSVFDIVTGVTLAVSRGELSSRIALNGFTRKIGIYVIVGVAVVLDELFGMNMVLRGATIGFFISTEGLSIIENWEKFGLPLPKKLRDAITKVVEEKE